MKPDSGGCSSHGGEGINAYVLFAARNFDSKVIQTLADEFYSVHKYTKKSIGGEIIDLDKDQRLNISLSKSEEGRSLYTKIYEKSPVICIGKSYIGDIYQAGTVKVMPLDNYRHDYKVMFDIIDKRMSKVDKKEESNNFLKFLNKLLILQPNIAGIGVNFNAILEKYINRDS